MRPYGRKPKHHNYKDNHPPKGHINWWEAELDSLNKKTERQKAQKIINEEIANNTEGKVIRPILAEPCAEPEYGNILYGSEYIWDIEKIESLNNPETKFISLRSPNPWEAAKRLNVNADTLKESLLYECPFIHGNKYFWMIPTAIVVCEDIKQYRKPNYSSSMLDFMFDNKLSLNSLRELDVIQKTMLGHGYTYFTLPDDGVNELKEFTINLNNGDKLLMSGWVWYNK